MDLDTTSAVIDILGGVGSVATLTGRTYNAAWNWTTFEHFPSDTYVVMTEALKAKGCTAPASLWRMVGAPEIQEAVN